MIRFLLILKGIQTAPGHATKSGWFPNRTTLNTSLPPTPLELLFHRCLYFGPRSDIEGYSACCCCRRNWRGSCDTRMVPLAPAALLLISLYLMTRSTHWLLIGLIVSPTLSKWHGVVPDRRDGGSPLRLTQNA